MQPLGRAVSRCPGSTRAAVDCARTPLRVRRARGLRSCRGCVPRFARRRAMRSTVCACTTVGLLAAITCSVVGRARSRGVVLKPPAQAERLKPPLSPAVALRSGLHVQLRVCGGSRAPFQRARGCACGLRALCYRFGFQLVSLQLRSLPHDPTAPSSSACGSRRCDRVLVPSRRRPCPDPWCGQHRGLVAFDGALRATVRGTLCRGFGWCEPGAGMVFCPRLATVLHTLGRPMAQSHPSLAWRWGEPSLRMFASKANSRISSFAGMSPQRLLMILSLMLSTSVPMSFMTFLRRLRFRSLRSVSAQAGRPSMKVAFVMTAALFVSTRTIGR